MATKTATTPADGVTTPQAPSSPQSLVRCARRPGRLGWAAVVAGCIAAAGLTAVTLSGADDRVPDTTPVPHSGLAEHGSIRAIEGSVEDTGPADNPAVPDTYSGLAEYGTIRAIEGSAEADPADNRPAPGSNPIPGTYSGLAEYGTIRAIEGSVEDDPAR